MKEKDNKVIYNIKVNTEKMYDHTIEEMVKRGCPESDIKAVEEAKANALAAYDMEEEECESPCATKSDVSDLLNTIGRVHENTTPLMSNLFIVRIGDVPIYQVRSFHFSPDEKDFSVGFYETREFSVIEYFLKNKKFGEVSIEYLTQNGETIRTDVFKSASVDKIMVDGLAYETDRPFGMYIKFNYKKYVPSAG